MERSFTYRLSLLVGVVTALAAGAQAGAVVILSTDLDGRTVSGSTASNLTWTTNGVDDPGDLSANFDLFDTTDAQDLFAVDRNIHNESAWLADISVQVQSAPIALTTFSLDAFIFSNAGAFQATQRDLDYLLELIDDANVTVDSVAVNDIYANSGTAVQPQNVSFDLAGNVLAANSNYVLRLTASGSGPGNNAGFDNPTLNGDIIVPEPMTATLGLLALGGLAAATRRRRAA